MVRPQPRSVLFCANGFCSGRYGYRVGMSTIANAISITRISPLLNKFACALPFSPNAVPAPGFYGGVALPIGALLSWHHFPWRVSHLDGHSVVEKPFSCGAPTKRAKFGCFSLTLTDSSQIDSSLCHRKEPLTKREKTPIFQRVFLSNPYHLQKVYNLA